MSLAHWLSGASLWGLKTSVLKRERAGRRTMISCGMDPSAEAQPAGVICSSMSFSARHSPPSWEVYLITWAPFAAATRFFSWACSDGDARHVTAVTSVTTATLTVELTSPPSVEPPARAATATSSPGVMARPPPRPRAGGGGAPGATQKTGLTPHRPLPNIPPRRGMRLLPIRSHRTGVSEMTWETPTFEEVKMDAEINSYQEDSDDR